MKIIPNYVKEQARYELARRYFWEYCKIKASNFYKEDRYKSRQNGKNDKIVNYTALFRVIVNKFFGGELYDLRREKLFGHNVYSNVWCNIKSLLARVFICTYLYIIKMSFVVL